MASTLDVSSTLIAVGTSKMTQILSKDPQGLPRSAMIHACYVFILATQRSSAYWILGPYTQKNKKLQMTWPALAMQTTGSSQICPYRQMSIVVEKTQDSMRNTLPVISTTPCSSQRSSEAGMIPLLFPDRQLRPRQIDAYRRSYFPKTAMAHLIPHPLLSSDLMMVQLRAKPNSIPDSLQVSEQQNLIPESLRFLCHDLSILLSLYLSLLSSFTSLFLCTSLCFSFSLWNGMA